MCIGLHLGNCVIYFVQHLLFCLNECEKRAQSNLTRFVIKVFYLQFAFADTTKAMVLFNGYNIIKNSLIKTFLMKKKTCFLYNMVYYLWTLFVSPVYMNARLLKTGFWRSQRSIHWKKETIPYIWPSQLQVNQNTKILIKHIQNTLCNK